MKKKIAPKTSATQDRIAAMPAEYEEFQLLERSFNGTYCHSSVAPEFEAAALGSFNDLDRLFGFENESVMRKTGVETSHWSGRKGHA